MLSCGSALRRAGDPCEGASPGSGSSDLPEEGRAGRGRTRGPFARRPAAVGREGARDGTSGGTTRGVKHEGGSHEHSPG